MGKTQNYNDLVWDVLRSFSIACLISLNNILTALFQGSDLLYIVRNVGMNDVSAIVAFVISLTILRHIRKNFDRLRKQKRLSRFSLYGGLLFAAAYCLGYNIENLGSSFPIWMDNNISIGHAVFMIVMLLKLCGAWVISYLIIYFLFRVASNKTNNSETTKRPNGIIEKISSMKFSHIFYIAVVVRIIFLLIYFPGIATFDTTDQLRQAIGISQMSWHHSPMMTIIISLFIKLAGGNMTIGVGLYTITQILFTSAITAYALKFVKATFSPKPAIYAIPFCFLLFFPAICLYSVVLWKDIILAYGLLLYSIFLYKFALNSNESPTRSLITFIPTAIFCIFAKATGWWIVILTLPCLFIKRRHATSKIAAIFMVIVLSMGVQYCINSVYHPNQADKRETLSIVMQQIARTVKHHKNEISSDDLFTIDKVQPVEKMDSLYKPFISDPVKSQYDTQALASNLNQYTKTYFSLAFKYPYTFTDAFLCGNFGYWYPYKYWVFPKNNTIPDLLPDNNHIRNSISDALRLLGCIPIIGLLFRAGFYTYLIVLCLMYSFYVRRRSNIIFLMPSLVVLLTCLASPVASEFRYVLPMVLTAPLFLAFKY